ncbi:helix-turn-helix domain-containing protein [Salinimicrobium sediminilitoris]|uniref:helix-turn-helix domain-containing protein n=1 Tax=Salinimicrobium sediminilitoris TaxID=2876715 RepID=UPI001E4A2C73|nr:helix-turn-helix domain-containing protein [Salinimicrobium sediminilitoris]MCC8358376.1 helix-turn-helix domain-containing protein [Salinimicrobium sediminilitoris]
MSKTITQLHEISPEELRREIRNDIRLELQELAEKLTPKEPEIWITRQEAAEFLGVSLVTIYNWSKEGVIHPFKIGTRIRFKKSEILKVLHNSNKRASK